MLSVIIIAKNEARVIARCLESVSFADEIIVLDSGSTDQTVAIAKSFTHKVFSTDWQGYGIQKQRALEKASCDWVLNLDADERVTDDLKINILQAMQNKTADAYRIPIRMCFQDHKLRFSASPKRHVRLFKREGARYSADLIHEKVLLPRDAQIKSLHTPILHNSFYDLNHALAKLNRYSSSSAETYIKKGRKASVSRALFSSLWLFFRCYILQAGFLDGRLGVVFAALQAQGSWYRGLKQIYPDGDKIAVNSDHSSC